MDLFPDQNSHALDKARRIFAIIDACAKAGTKCPSNQELAQRVGYSSTAGPSGAIGFLETAGLIQVARKRASRVVTICSTGHKTADAAPARKHVKGTQATAQEKIDRLAEELANGAPSVPIAAKRAGLNPALAWRYFARIRQQLGWQAI